jgi:hypothetical protein
MPIISQNVRFAESAGPNNPLGIYDSYKPSRLMTGSGIPAITIGENYWQYLDGDTGILYTKSDGSWISVIDYPSLGGASSVSFMPQSTGVVAGGALSTGTMANSFKVASGTGTVVDTAVEILVWPEQDNQTPLFIGALTFVSIDATGLVIQASTRPNNSQQRTQIFLGCVVHVDGATINGFDQEQQVIVNPASQLGDLLTAIGQFRIMGLIPIPVVGTLNLDISYGKSFIRGGNFIIDATNPNSVDYLSRAGVSFQYRLSDGTNYTSLSNNAFIPNFYENPLGTVMAVSVGDFTIQYIYHFPNGDIKVQLGQTIYDRMDDAIVGIGKENYTYESFMRANGITIAYLIIQQGATNLDDPATSRIYSTGGIGQDVSGGAAAAFDQSLNTTDSPTFANLTVGAVINTSAVNGLLPNGNLTLSGTGMGSVSLLSVVDFNSNSQNNVSTINGIDISARDLILTSTTVTANGAVQRAGDTMTGQLLAIDGSAVVPSVGFASDTNTGIFSVGVDGFGISAGGITQAIIGVGQTTYDCEFNATGQILGKNGTAASPSISFTNNSITGIFSAASDSLGFSTAGTEALRVDNVGNVGIGTTAPTQRLTVSGNINATGTITAIGQILGKTGTALSPSISFTNDNLTGIFQPAVDSLAISCAGSEFVRVDGFGNVGVGTSAPTQRLTVSGNINATGSMTAGTVITAGSRFDALNSVGLRYTFSSDTDTGINYLAADNFALTTAAVDRMTLSTTGIGMTLPLAMGANTITSTNLITGGTFRTGSGVAGYGFTADANSGMSFVGANKIALTSNGSDKLIVEASLVSTTEDFTAGINDISALTMTSTGTFLAPSTIGARYVFSGDTDTGLYYVGNNSFALTTFGTNRLIVSTTAVTLATTLAMGTNNITGTGTISATTITANAVNGTVTGDFAALTCTTVNAVNTSTAQAGFRANGGTPVVPSYSYTSDTNTGTYQPAVDQLAITCGGTQTVTFSGTATTLNTGYLQLPASSIAAPAIRLPLTGPGSLVGYIADHGSANTLSIGINNVGLFLINSSEIITGTNIRPGATNTSLCGLSSRRWLNVYGLDITGTNAYTTPSDSRLKYDIHPCEFSLDFINGIEPVCYKWNDPTWYGTNESCGFIAQQVLGVIEGLGYDMTTCDIVGISTPDVDDPDQTAYYNMKTTSIIPALVGSIHELTARIVALEAAPVRLTTISEKMTSSDESTTAHVGGYSKSEKSALTSMRKEMKAMKASIVGLRAELDSLNTAEMLRSQREDDNAFEHL